MPISTFPVDPRETLPMSVENMTFMLDRLHRDCSPLQYIRELTQNGIEAIEPVIDARPRLSTRTAVHSAPSVYGFEGPNL